MITVYWDATCDKNPAFRVLINTPVHALSAAPRGDHLRCPALQDYYRNAFNIITPFTTHFKVSNGLQTSGDDVLMDAKKYDEQIVMQIYPSYIFYSDAEVMVQLSAPHLTPALPVTYLNGEYNIKHWIRPIQPALALKQDLQINEGDAIAGVRFITQNNEAVKLIRKALSEDEKTCLNACKQVTTIKNSGNQLGDLYTKHDQLKQSLTEKG